MIDEMPKDIVKELQIRAAIEQISGTLFERAENEIEQLRKELAECEELLDEYRKCEMDRNRWENTIS